MKHRMFLLSVLVAGAVQAENFWPNSDFEQGGEVPSGYTTPSGDPSMTRWAEPAASGSHTLGIVDTKSDTFANWVSDRVVLPQSAIGKTIRIKYKELFNMADGYARLSVMFQDSTGKNIKAGTMHLKKKGASEGWDSKKFTEATQPVDVPPQAVSMRIALVSAGGMKATGKSYIDDLEVLCEGAAIAKEESDVKTKSPEKPRQSLSREYKARLSTVRDYQLPQPEINASAKDPNIIYILVDDMGWGDLSCYPSLNSDDPESETPTPQIDKLAASGVRFTNGYADHLVCAPTRAAILAGRHQQRVGWYGFPEAMAGIDKADATLLPVAMKNAGYQTALIGKWHLGFLKGSTPLDCGFDRFFGFLGGAHDYFVSNFGQSIHGVSGSTDAYIYDQNQPVQTFDYLTDEFTDRSIDFVDNSLAAKKPFFLFLAYNAPHAPMQVPWEDLEPYAAARPGGKYTSRDIYRAMVVRLDRNIGRLMSHLEETGQIQNTLVIFSSDNGGMQMAYNGGLRGRKGYFYEGGIRVPMMASWPCTIPAGQVIDVPVITHDVYKTALGAAGVTDVPSGVEGVNWIPFLTGEKTQWPRRPLYWGNENDTVKWAVRDGNWKLVNDDVGDWFGSWPKQDPGNKNRPKPVLATQLFDVSADPKETTDLSAEYPEVVARLQKMIGEFYASCPDSLSTPAVEASSKQLKNERKDLGKYPREPRLDGAPGHYWNKQDTRGHQNVIWDYEMPPTLP